VGELRVEVDYESDEYQRFARNYKGLMSPAAAYARAKRDEAIRELKKDGIYVDSNGILNQKW